MQPFDSSLAAGFLTLACACTVSAGEPSDAASSFNESCMSQGLWTGAVVIAGTPDRVLCRKAWGWMDPAKTSPMHEDAVFDLASLTKAVATAAALAVCIDRGLIDPEAPFSSYLPRYRGVLTGPVTVRDLARHLSGFDNQKPYDVEGQVTERILDFGPVRPAGESWVYSCANFILLGMIVEQVSRKSLAEVCHEHLFAPLGMRRTCWAPLPDPDPRHVVGQAATGTPLGVASDPPARHAQRPIGNAGLFSTADDLSVFCRMMLAGGTFDGRRILSDRSMQLLRTRPDGRSPFAFGWVQDPGRNPPSLSPTTLSHTGWAGHSLWIDLEGQRYVLVLTNRSGDHAQATAARIRLAEALLRGE